MTTLPMYQPIFQSLGAGKLTILLFHKVPRNVHPLSKGELDLSSFQRVLEFVVSNFKVLPLQDALSCLARNQLPPRAASITFDDGYPDWLPGPVRLLQQHQAHATFFVTTGQFQGEPMWNERILHAVAAAGRECPPLVLHEAGGATVALATDEDKRATILSLDRLIKYQPPERKARLLAQLEAHVGVAATRAPVMSPDDVRAIHSLGFGVGAHSVSHPILALCTQDKARDEIGGAREHLESIIRAPVTAFAYPNGIPDKDFHAGHVELVREAGYAFALTTQRGVATAGTSLFEVPRFTPWGPSNLRMALQLTRNLREPARLAAPADRPKRKALMVAFHFPPQAGSSGILRTLNFVKYLPRNGWQPLVLSAHPRAYVECRDDLLKSIPSGTPVVRAQALDAAKHLSIKGKYPGWLALPDRWGSWWPGAFAAGMKLIREQQPDVIWSTYPIATAHLIGASLARHSGLPWIADFRDPMINGDYPSDPLQRRLWQRLEACVLRQATRCVFTTERAAQVYRDRYPEHAGKCLVIENGYDEDAFEGNAPHRAGVPDDKLLLLHSGIIYPRDRDPSSFFKAIAGLVADGVLRKDSLCVRFRAPHHGAEVRALAEQAGLAEVVDIAPPIPYREAIAEMLAADLLLVFQGCHFNSQIPAKIYEYLRSATPVLGLVDLQGDTARKLGGFPSVALASIDQAEEIEAALRHWLENRSRADFRAALREDAESVRLFSRSTQAKALGAFLDQIRVPKA